MARRTTTERPERPEHSVDEKRQDIIRLQRRINELEAFDPTAVTKRFTDPAVLKLQTAIASTLSDIFGERTFEHNRYGAAERLDDGSMSMETDWISARSGGGYRNEAAEACQYLTEGKVRALALLNQAVQSLEEEIEFAPPEPAGFGSNALQSRNGLSRRVFIVHGHDDGAREGVARYLQKIGFEPIILHEQANQGRTVIEKVEANGDVGFAVVLLTPDDVGSKRGETPQPRARQNVLLELGYFIGSLGRSKVCALMRGQVEVPSDFAGAVWEPLDDAGGWRQVLARELEAAGHEINWNTVMRS